MLRIIMTEDADYSQLRAVGVSEDGIDFVAQLLTRDPHSRPNQKQCFQHPWIANIPDLDQYEDDEVNPDVVEELSDIGEDVEDELDASQLSLNGRIGSPEQEWASWHPARSQRQPRD